MGKRFSKRRWRRPERMMLEHPPVVRRKDLGASEPVTIEPELARKASRRGIEILIVSFVVLAVIEGLIIGLVSGVGWILAPAVGLYAIVYFVIGREFGDAWLARALRAKPNASARLVRLVNSEARAAGVPAPRLLMSGASAPNAFSFALRRRWVVVTSAAEGEDELALEGMFAHEVIHLRDGDASVASLYIVLAASPELVIRRAGLLALLSVPLWPAALALRIARKAAAPPDREHRADIAAAMLTRYPPGIATALRSAGGGSSGLRSADPFWFVARGTNNGDALRRADLVSEM